MITLNVKKDDWDYQITIHYLGLIESENRYKVTLYKLSEDDLYEKIYSSSLTYYLSDGEEHYQYLLTEFLIEYQAKVKEMALLFVRGHGVL